MINTPTEIEAVPIYYTKADIKHIGGIDLWAEDCIYMAEMIDITLLGNYKEIKKLAKTTTSGKVASMANTVGLGRDLPAIIIEGNKVVDGVHRTMAYIISEKTRVNALIRLKLTR